MLLSCFDYSQSVVADFFARGRHYDMDYTRSPLFRGSTDRSSVLKILIEVMAANARRILPRLPASATKDIKREVEEMCSIDYIKDMIMMRQKEFRRSTLIKKGSTPWCRSWKKGMFSLHSDIILMTPTNKRTISWLDIDQYTMDYGETFPSGESVQSLLRRTSSLQVLDTYNLETGRQSCLMELARFFRDYMTKIEQNMRLEYMYNAAVALVEKWSNEKFNKYTNSVDFMFRVDREFHLSVFPRLLVEYCNNTEIVVSYFMLLNSEHPCVSNKPVEYIVKHMSHPYLQFFMLHIMNAVSVHQEKDRFMSWINLHLGLIKTAFITGEAETLKLLLGFGWPCEFSFNLYDDSPVSRLNWPRRTRESSAASPHSPAFTAAFILYLVINTKAIKSTTSGCDIAHCIRMFWRAIPAPFVSISDMHRLVRILVKGEYDLQLVLTLHGMARWAEKLISMYPKDCLITNKPRSLMHLTRCKIRAAMKSMVYVNHLPLPTNLKDYLWLRW